LKIICLNGTDFSGTVVKRYGTGALNTV